MRPRPRHYKRVVDERELGIRHGGRSDQLMDGGAGRLPVLQEPAPDFPSFQATVPELRHHSAYTVAKIAVPNAPWIRRSGAALPCSFTANEAGEKAAPGPRRPRRSTHVHRQVASLRGGNGRPMWQLFSLHAGLLTINICAEAKGDSKFKIQDSRQTDGMGIQDSKFKMPR